MSLELINPEELPTPQSYTQVVAATGSRPKITIYVVGYRREYLPDISEARVAAFGDHKPAASPQPVT
jgi:hypothetical protein